MGFSIQARMGLRMKSRVNIRMEWAKDNWVRIQPELPSLVHFIFDPRFHHISYQRFHCIY